MAMIGWLVEGISSGSRPARNSAAFSTSSSCILMEAPELHRIFTCLLSSPGLCYFDKWLSPAYSFFGGEDSEQSVESLYQDKALE